MNKRISTILTILVAQTSSVSAFWPFDPPKAIVEVFPIENVKLTAKEKDTRIAFVSDAFIYPVPSPTETFPPPPTSKIGIMYRESQVLLQEAIKDFLAGINGYDLVLFGGSMTANQDHYPLFEDISYDLTKYGLEYYSMIGYGETSGSKAGRELIKKPYYLLTVEDINLLVLDNVTEKIVPERLPEEASKQYIWLTKTLKGLNNKSTELYIFSYYPLDAATLDLIKTHDKLNIVLLANSGAHKFSIGTHDKYPELNNAALSIYPCAFTVIERLATGKLQIKVVHTRLRGVKAKAQRAITKD
jgi:hypothetical protein